MSVFHVKCEYMRESLCVSELMMSVSMFVWEWTEKYISICECVNVPV